ncbi:iron permease [Trametes punicea]|nr:iron permease [Trametes punicea]
MPSASESSPVMQEPARTEATMLSAEDAPPKRGLDFWMVYVSNLLVDMLSVLDVMAVSTCLPTIVHHLNGTDFIWVGSAFTVASTAIIPLIGHLVDGFGRKPVLLAFIVIFAAGSAICGAAQSMNMLIAGRAIQGFGGGGCLSITEIIYADMVPLTERAKFQGIIAAVWALGCAIGPLIGGAFADSGAWRWLFYMNLPLCGVSLLMTSVFLRVQSPKFDLLEVMRSIDWIGIFVIVGSTISVLIAMTWGGLRFPWSSSHVLTPLIMHGAGVFAFFMWEGRKILPKKWRELREGCIRRRTMRTARANQLDPEVPTSDATAAQVDPALARSGTAAVDPELQGAVELVTKNDGNASAGPDAGNEASGGEEEQRKGSKYTIPEQFFTNRTVFSGYLGTFFHGIVSLGAIFYLPVFFQGVRDASPIRSGVDILPLTLTIPFAAIILGSSVKRLGGRYRYQNWIGWAITVLGFGVLSTVTENSSRAQYIATQIPAGLGIGAIWVATQLPILAPLPYSNNAHALAFHIFLRRFAQSFGIAIGGTIIQNVLLHDLPPAYVKTLPKGVELAYAIIPTIAGLQEPLKDQVRHAFAQSTQLLWRVMIGISGAGLLSSFLMEEWSLRTARDDRWVPKAQKQGTR